MSDEAVEAEAYAAREMQLLLNHAGFQRAVDATVTRLCGEWERAETQAERDMAWHTLRALRALVNSLRSYSQRKPLTLA